MADRVVIGRVLGTPKWIELTEYRNNEGILKGYVVDRNEWEGSFRKRDFYHLDEVELRRFIDVAQLRIEIAKGVLPAIIQDKNNTLESGSTNRFAADVDEAVAYADALIKRLKQVNDL